ncbi:hypothetical protein FHR23_002564 [Stakelama sediminis]|uniref:Uncharacterized protein n=1 Tax=Stakelama sediminis TaxID=463200 RepID=A0A840Z1M8_9SPHN|nr:hypothetical protein [Stakelama sediminis]
MAGFGAALLAFFFVLPFILGHRCEQAGGRFNRIKLTCTH